ncbi:MAG: T9SS type A sorting domain-containing protein [Sphingobacteriales bacterium]|nr:T9SS type A sorting domain-containing protein [Sphingobacteriales bacterium]
MTDINGAIEYEFNMLKNPTTGKIPDGIRDAELLQAREILAKQMLTERIEANAYTFQGPNNLGGRTRALAYDIRYDGVANFTIFAGGVSGALYKSTDDGATWTRKSPAGDLQNVSALAQDIRVGSRDTWYYAGGEWTGNSASAHGTTAPYRGKGVFKSTDNGETWSHLPASNTGTYESFDHRADYITKLVVDPTNGNVYMGAMDAIYRSTDGGTSWSIVLTSGSSGYGSDDVSDIIVTSTGRFYASFAGGANTGPTLNLPGVWTSTTGADGSWTKIAGPTSGTSPAGWNAAGAFGRVVLAYAPSLESRVYALYWNGVTSSCTPGLVEAEFYYWDDGTSTWTDVSATLPDESGCLAGNDPFAVQGGYDLVVAVKPDASGTVFIGGTNIYRSTDAGSTWTRIGGYASSASYALYTSSHPDIHSIAFPPTSSTTMLCGNDGGIQRTTDNTAGTVAWTQINTGYRTYQYYYVDIDPRTSNDKVIGGAQDNGSTRNTGGTGTSFEMVWGGDGVSVGLNDPAATSGTQYEYVGSQAGSINRRSAPTALGSSTTITPIGEAGTGLFVTLFKLDADNSEFLYYANDDKIYRTLSASTVSTVSWTDMTGISAAVTTTISALAVSRGGYSAATSSLFFGTSGGKVYRLDDPALAPAATSPVDITGASFPAGAYVSSIAVNPRNDDTILVTFSNYGVTSVWWTGTANSATPTWTSVEGSLTLPSYRSCAIHAVPNSPEVHYFVGTSVGLYRSTGLPGSVSWSQEGAGEIGNAVVSSMSFRPSDGKLLVGTHGYGMWYTMLSLVPLPVELTEFTGTLQNNKTTLLQWTTSSEYNTKHFELEKSFDGIHYSRIATIGAAGNSNTIREYSYTDRSLTEKNYYRLRTVDIDNESKLSNVVLVKLSGAQQDIQVLGNPFRNNILVIRFMKPPEAKGELRLMDINGHLVARRTIGQGEQQLQFNIPMVSSGAYILNATINGRSYTAKVIRN